MPTRRRVRLHIGTAEIMARLVLLEARSALAPRDSAFAQIVCEEPVVAFRGDRFILRSESADRTIGGGSVVHPLAPRHRVREKGVAALLERIRSADTDTAAVAMLQMDAEFSRPPGWLAQALDVAEENVVALASHPELEPLPGPKNVEALTTRTKWVRWIESAVTVVGEFHRKNPLLPGMEMELLRAQLPGNASPKLFREIVERLAAEKRLARSDSTVRLPTHEVALNQEERELSDRLEAVLAEGAFTPPDTKEIAERLRVPLKRVQELLQALERNGRAAKVTGDLWYHPRVLGQVREMVAARIRAAGAIGAAEFRDLIGATRKYAIPVLEYFDRTGFTIRVGDQRKLRKS